MAQLQATDPEGEPLIYGVSGEEAMKYFSVNKDTGVVWLRQQLDREVWGRRTHTPACTLLTHANYQSKFTADKNGIQGHFENSRWNVNHQMMKGQRKYHLQKEKKKSSEQYSNASPLLSLHGSGLANVMLTPSCFATRPSQRCRSSST